jgi:hypothetical protein
MVTANEFLAMYIMEYQNILTEMELFDKNNPDNKDGYNVLIKLAEQIQTRAKAAGFTDLPKLPERK